MLCMSTSPRSSLARRIHRAPVGLEAWARGRKIFGATPSVLRTVVVLVAVVIGVGAVAVDTAFAGPPTSLPPLDSLSSSTEPQSLPAPPLPAPQSPAPKSTPSTSPPALPPPTATSTSLRMSRRKSLAKLSFACQNAGTARLRVRIGRRAWSSTAKRYTCRKADGQVTIALPKKIARRLRHPSRNVAASLTIKDGPTLRTLAVNLGRTSRSAHTASSVDGFWPSTVSVCDRQDIGYGPQGSIDAGIPQIEYWPHQFPTGWMFYWWRTWLFIWDGNANQWLTPVAGTQTGSDGSSPWSHPSIGWLDDYRVLTGADLGSQGYTVAPDHNYYTVVAAQSYYEDVNGQFYGGETHLVHNSAATNGGLHWGEFCWFP
jgi:hypothetical protein